MNIAVRCSRKIGPLFMDIDKTTVSVYYLIVRTNDDIFDFTRDVDPKIGAIMSLVLNSQAHICHRRASMS